MVIIFFPEVIENELLFNILALYVELMRFPNLNSMFFDIHKYKKGNFSAILPIGINLLLQELPEGHHFTAEELINDHTLFLYFSAYLTEDKENNFRTYLKEGYQGTYGRSFQDKDDFLRYCRKCVQEDKASYGRCFWRREHQLPYVHICCHHLDPLWQTTFAMAKLARFITLEQAIAIDEGEPVIIPASIDFNLLVQVSRDSFWLLTQRPLDNMASQITKKYTTLLTQHDLISNSKFNKTQRIRREVFAKQFAETYSSECLEYFGVGNPEASVKWVNNILYRSLSVNVIKHILLTRFLGYTVEELWTQEFDPPEPLYPCLNRFCSQFEHVFIKDITIRRDVGSQDKWEQTIEIACPTCGMSYSRTLTSSTDDNIFEIGRVVIRGWVWEDMFKNLWDSLISMTDLLVELKMAPKTVYEEAIRLNLSPYRPHASAVLAFRKLLDGPNWQDKAMSENHDITDTQWDEIKPIIDRTYEFNVQIHHRHRNHINAILWKYYSGLGWTLMPKHYGDAYQVRSDLKFWRSKGIMTQICDILGIKYTNHF